jgi:hypothetical protein
MGSKLTAAGWNISGLIANLAGVVLLFLFGMPFRVRTQGRSILVAHSVSDKAGRLESLYDAASWLGLALIVLGTSAQVFAAVMAR